MRKLLDGLLKILRLHHSKAWYRKHHAMAQKFYKQGKKREALNEYKNILQDNPRDEVALTHLLIIEDRMRKTS